MAKRLSWGSDGPLKRLRNFFESVITYAAFGVLGRTPPALSEGVGRRLGRLAYWAGWRREVVESQIAKAYPEKDEEWVRSTAKACFEHVGGEALGLAALMRGGLDEVRRRIVGWDGQDSFQSAFDEGRGVVIVSAHFGNWEFAGSSLAAKGFPVDAVMLRLANRAVSRYVEEMRGNLGMGLIFHANAWKRMAASLAEGRVVAFVADQDARDKGVFIPFFGRPASTHRSPALLALRTGTPFFVGGAHRVGPRQYHCWTVRLDPAEGVDTREQVLDLTRRWVAEVERRVRLYPEQYFWHHRRWKWQPSGTA
jgi:KDO2-lipid IV(A) lauroyltransferase